jgi:pimeloyl-ACP methyl ester carboxylesterase
MAQVVADLGAVHGASAGGAPALVGGLSIGGLVAMEYALDQPERVRALALCNTGPGFKNPEAAAQWSDMLERAAQKLEEVGIAGYLEGRRARAELLGLDPESAGAQDLRRAILGSSVAGLVRFARQVAGPVPNLVDRLAEIAAPVLVLVGSEDLHFQRASHVLASKLPRARRVEVAGAGHVLNVDQPEAFTRHILEFWEFLGA